MPLYFLDFDTDWTDYLVVNGQMYTGNQAPPQGITTEMIGWTPSASAYGWPGYGWHACTMSGLKPGDFNFNCSLPVQQHLL